MPSVSLESRRAEGPPEVVDAVVIGAGVVGLAVARRLALAGREVIVLEAEADIGMGTSSRNSEVVHAGLYYPTGSIKAQACVAGRRRLVTYCAERGIPCRAIGKLIVAVTLEETGKLEAIWRQAIANGVEGLVRLSEAEAKALEPNVRCVDAIHSTVTGIVDSHAYMLALLGDLEAAGGSVVLQTRVDRLDVTGGRLRIETRGTAAAAGDGPGAALEARLVVNAAGHGAPKLIREAAGFPAKHAPWQWYAKGNYFSIAGKQPFSRLVYPLPDAAGLGIHATVDLAGRCRFGPDVQWVESEQDLIVDPSRQAMFEAAIRRYWPDLPSGALQPDYAGVRPKLHDAASPMPDFRIDGPEVHGIAGLVNLLGIESPGLTSSLALADLVAAHLGLGPTGT